MKWTPEQTAKLRKMCMEGCTNDYMALTLGCPVTEIHRKRSDLGITRAKIAAMKRQELTAEDVNWKEREKERKNKFVRCLGYLLRAAECNVNDCDLLDDNTVRVEYASGSHRDVNIAGDSLAAIILDVTRQACT